VTSASVCCGAHAGTPEAILATLEEAARLGVAVGAHPGFADREGFGRRERVVSAVEVECLILEQVEGLAVLAGKVGVPLRFLKPHGALYNQAQRDLDVAEGVVAAASRLRSPVLGQPGSVLERKAREAGVRFVSEGFPDRRYRDDGRLVARGAPDALLVEPDEIAAQVARLVQEGLETLCIHGDDPRAVRNAEVLAGILQRDGCAARFWG
jgi:UPF0271 protein